MGAITRSAKAQIVLFAMIPLDKMTLKKLRDHFTVASGANFRCCRESRQKTVARTLGSSRARAR
jgi:hypothetical protein